MSLLARAALATSLAWMALPAQAQLSPTPTPGLWEQESRVLVNGQDVAAMVRQMQAQMAQHLPPEQRKQLEAQMNQAGMNGPTRECLTAEEVARYNDPKKIIAEMQKESPHCKFTPGAMTASTVTFTGRCDDPNGFTGDVKGDVQLLSAKEWKGRFSGKGKAPTQMPTGMAGGADGAMTMLAESRGRWLSAQCGEVKPRAR